MEPSREQLVDAAAELGVALSAEQAQRLLDHLRLLARWNRAHNLVGRGDPADWLFRHTLDSLAPVPHLPAGAGIDVGSGAGFPGVPVAVARPDCHLTLCEPRQKRLAFLRTTVAELGLSNVDLWAEPVGSGHSLPPFDFALSRATLPIGDWLALAAGLVRDRGVVVAFLGLEPSSEESLRSEGADHGLDLRGRRPYRIGSGPERVLGIFERGAPRGST